MSAIVGRTTRSATGQQDRPAARRPPKWTVPAVLAACYAVFAVAVHLRLFDSVDVAVRDASRPGDVWGPLQVRAAGVVRQFDPVRITWALVLTTAMFSALRRSVRPLAVVGVIGLLVAMVTLGTKWLMARSSSATTPVGHSSFPSGHTVSVLIAFGLLVLLLQPGGRRTWILPAFAASVVGSALVISQIHPATDVVGAALLAVAALSGAQAAGLVRWANATDRSGSGRTVCNDLN